MSTARWFAFSLLLLSAPIATQASITTLPSACTTPMGTPGITTNGLPQLGNGGFAFDYTGPNVLGTLSVQPHLVIGFAPLGPVSIPTSWFPQQPVNCNLRVRHDLVRSATEGPGVYHTFSPLAIPNNPALNGVVFYAQWLVVHTQCGIVPPCWNDWVATSDTLALTIGV